MKSTLNIEDCLCQIVGIEHVDIESILAIHLLNTITGYIRCLFPIA